MTAFDPDNPPSALSSIEEWLSARTDDLISIRRDLHAHPELGRDERRTTEHLRSALSRADLSPVVLPGGTGLICDIGDGPRIALRADIDALPMTDAKSVAYRSVNEGVTHACGHDVHTTVVLGAALLAARLHQQGLLPVPVRVVFQPAEEVMPGGAHDVIEANGLAGIEQILGLHCDPSLPVGKLGLRVGAITAASDMVEVELTGRGGHTARPHLTEDLVSALAAVVAGAPAALGRRIDPRAGCALVWGQISAGTVSNAIPRIGFARGTLRTLDVDVWESVPPMLDSIVREIAAAWGVSAKLNYSRGVPPVVNTEAGISLLRKGIQLTLPADTETATSQSLGGEDFGWFLTHTSGAMARLGVGVPGAEAYDLHQPDFDVDERCIGIGVRVLIGAVLASAA